MLFKSFEDLSNNILSLKTVLDNIDKYYAHTKPSDKSESLIEHIEKVNEYFLILISFHELETIIEKIIENILKNNKKEFENISELGSFIKELFFASIVFHDYGKINENFQIEKMENNSNGFSKYNNGLKSTHSQLSAFLFLNFYLSKIQNANNFNKYEKPFLRSLAFLFSIPIIKHHSSLFINPFFNCSSELSFFQENIIQNLVAYLNKLKIDLLEEDRKKFFNKLQVENLFQTKLPKLIHSDEFINIYLLLKLNFSLLTASDYYATNSYMNDFDVKEFGLIDEKLKDKLKNNFKEYKFNKDLYNNLEYYNQLPFEEIEERSGENLNKLRQKLGAEVITNIRKFKDDNLFYLEAPTGAGKTNLSLACSIELLEACPELNKIIYVFPFTTLITQTFDSIKKTLGVTNDKIIEIHSKAGFHKQEQEEAQDGNYGKEKINFIDNLFVNYPITLFTHIKFFDILKKNDKETNYILHRLSNSIVIIDELQSYPPEHWDKVILFLENYAKYFNIKFILMSATLPKIDELLEHTKGKIQKLVINKEKYFTNANFKARVNFDFSLIDSFNNKDENYLNQLAKKVYEEAENYAKQNNNCVKVVIEFITKKNASKFFYSAQTLFKDYEVILLSGDILETRRRQIVRTIKGEENRKDNEKKQPKKILLVSTQVIEAGVDIDMDLGFKDKSLLDSDEQLAGRVNRNAMKNNCKVFIFDSGSAKTIYSHDERYKQMKEEISVDKQKEIIQNKNFDDLYSLVIDRIRKKNSNKLRQNFDNYKNHFCDFKYSEINFEFQLIEQDTISIFIPLDIPLEDFGKEEESPEIKLLRDFKLVNEKEEVSGAELFKLYRQVISNKKPDFIEQATEMKKLGGLMAKFTISQMKPKGNTSNIQRLIDCTEESKNTKDFFYLTTYKGVYDYKHGFTQEFLNNSADWRII